VGQPLENVLRAIMLGSTVPLARYLRWKITGPAAAWETTFRAIVAANPSTPRDILDGLAEDHSPAVINALAGNSALPHAIHRVRECGTSHT